MRAKREGQRTIRLDTAENVVHVVREESASVQHRLDHPGDSLERHLLAMRVLVPLRRQLCAVPVRPYSSTPAPSRSPSHITPSPLLAWSCRSRKNSTHLEALLDPLHKVLAVRREPIRRQHRIVRPGISIILPGHQLIPPRTTSSKAYAQLPHLARISGLDVVVERLSRIARNDREIRTGDSEDTASVVLVRVEAAAVSAAACCGGDTPYCSIGADVSAMRGPGA